MLPSLGFQEILLLGVLALVVVGPKDLPLMLRKLGRWTAKLRGMAQEFRSGFDELARQAELDELKKEVDALRRNQVFNDIGKEMSKPLPSMDPIPPPPVYPALEAPTVSSPASGGSVGGEADDDGGGRPLSQSAARPDSSPASGGGNTPVREVVDESAASWPDAPEQRPEPAPLHAVNEDDATPLARSAP